MSLLLAAYWAGSVLFGLWAGVLLVILYRKLSHRRWQRKTSPADTEGEGGNAP